MTVTSYIISVDPYLCKTYGSSFVDGEWACVFTILQIRRKKGK